MSEKKLRIMRTRGSFWMVLYAKNRFVLVPKPLNCLIVEVDPIDLNFAGKGIRIDGETVILRRDFDPATFQILNWLVRPPVSELEFEGFCT